MKDRESGSPTKTHWRQTSVRRTKSRRAKHALSGKKKSLRWRKTNRRARCCRSSCSRSYSPREMTKLSNPSFGSSCPSSTGCLRKARASSNSKQRGCRRVPKKKQHRSARFQMNSTHPSGCCSLRWMNSSRLCRLNCRTNANYRRQPLAAHSRAYGSMYCDTVRLMHARRRGRWPRVRLRTRIARTGHSSRHAAPNFRGCRRSRSVRRSVRYSVLHRRTNHRRGSRPRRHHGNRRPRRRARHAEQGPAGERTPVRMPRRREGQI